MRKALGSIPSVSTFDILEQTRLDGAIGRAPSGLAGATQKRPTRARRVWRVPFLSTKEGQPIGGIVRFKIPTE